MQISEQGLEFIRQFEGLYLKAYRDSVGVVTIGYGITNYDIEDYKAITGRNKLQMGDTITKGQAEQLLKRAIDRKYAPAVEKVFGDKINQRVFDAGISFHYNTGAINKASWVKEFIKNGINENVHKKLLLWNKAGGKVLRGLTRRREGEWRIISARNYVPPK